MIMYDIVLHEGKEAMITDQNAFDYKITYRSGGSLAWVSSSQLDFVSSGSKEILEQWKSEVRSEVRRYADIDFIFEHGKEIVKSPHGVTIQALSTALGLGSLWPPNGEGFVYFERCQMVFSLAKPFLEAGDKGGFLKLCTEVKSIK